MAMELGNKNSILFPPKRPLVSTILVSVPLKLPLKPLNYDFVVFKLVSNVY